MEKFLRVDMTKKSARMEEAPQAYRYMGGRRLIAQLVLEEVPPACEPLGRHNKLIIAPGFLGGTPAPCSGRLSIGGKSPLTGGAKESNSGGPVAQMLSRLGYQAVIVEGKPDDGWYIMKIDHNGASFMDGKDLLGLDNYEACARLREKYGEKIGIILIGVAGERRYSLATCAVADLDGYPARHCARGGMGAVMGSKGLKAIIVDDAAASKVEYRDWETFRSLSGEWSKELAAGRKVMTEYGTANLVIPMSELGCLVTRNFSRGSYEHAQEISGQRLTEIIKERGGDPSHNCQRGCPIRCSNVYLGPDGQHLTSSLEFETIGLMGSNLELKNLDEIATLDRFCDGFGIDTMETGHVLGIAMEAGVASFGDFKGALGLLEELKKDTVLGRVFGQGAATTARVLGVSRAAVVKGQGIAAYDPRALKGTAVTYATSPMGADHTAGNCLPGRLGYRPETQEPRDTHLKEGQVELSKDLQVLTAVCDASGLCFFVGANTQTMELISQLFSARYGKELSLEDVLQIGKDTIVREIKFNELAGITKRHNRLPEFFLEEKLPPTMETFDIPSGDLETIFDEFLN